MYDFASTLNTIAILRSLVCGNIFRRSILEGICLSRLLFLNDYNIEAGKPLIKCTFFMNLVKKEKQKNLRKI